MHNIIYNMRFRKEVPIEMLDLFVEKGLLTGSTLMNAPKESEYSDIDIAILCSKEFIELFDQTLLVDAIENMALRTFIDAPIDEKLKDASQYIFDVLLKCGYSLYIKNNYRDSTFLSCYVSSHGQLYNLLLIDEENVFAEWQFATKQLFMQSDNPELFPKYNRVKFFEYKRKCFRRTLKIV